MENLNVIFIFIVVTTVVAAIMGMLYDALAKETPATTNDTNNEQDKVVTDTRSGFRLNAGNIGYVALTLGVIIRFIVTIISNQSFTDISGMYIWEKYFYALCLLLFGASFWNQFIRLRCTKCKSTNVRQIDKQLLSSEIVRHEGHSTEGTSNGHTRTTRYVEKIRIEKYQITYECLDCKNIWTKNITERHNLGKDIINSNYM